MSYIEAKQDCIPMTRNAAGFTVYYPPCKCCGEPVLTWSYNRKLTYLCPVCRGMKRIIRKFPTLP